MPPVQREPSTTSARVKASRSAIPAENTNPSTPPKAATSELVGFDGSAQRDLVAGVSDGDLDPRHALCGGDQAPIF